MKRNEIIKLDTHLKDCSPIYLGYNIIDKLIDYIEKLSIDKVFLITDINLFSIHGKKLFQYLSKHFPCEIHLIGAGDINKNIYSLVEMCNHLFASKITRDSLLISFGGGVIGNITGLAAGLIYRGIRFIEVPTTFLAQTDSVLSNKQAVNFGDGKNLLGIFHAPEFIFIDTKYISSESQRYFYSGLVETIKNGLISDKSLLTFIESEIDKELTEERIFDYVRKSIESKIEIIKRDPSEKKYCMILEYGHTIGHAVEMLSHGLNTHGESITIGMIAAAHISHLLGYISKEEVEYHYYIFGEKLKFKTSIPEEYPNLSIINSMIKDNKRTKQGLLFVLLDQIGVPHKVSENNYLLEVESSIIERAMNLTREKKQVLVS